MNKVAAIQMCSSADVDENLRSAEYWIEEAASNGARLIVLPEMFAIMGIHKTDKVAVQESFGHGKIQQFLSEQARKYRVWIVGGTIPISSTDKHKIRAAMLVYDDQGKVAARYDKMHLFDVVLSETESYKESDTIEPGNDLVVVQTPVGKLGLAVCYDVRFPELFRRLSQQGAEIFALPSAFTVKTGAAHWELLTRSRAVENFCYLMGAGQGGTHANGRQTYGHSLIVEPWGSVCAQQNKMSPGVIYTTIDLTYLNKIRQSIPALQHRRM